MVRGKPTTSLSLAGSTLDPPRRMTPAQAIAWQTMHEPPTEAPAVPRRAVLGIAMVLLGLAIVVLLMSAGVLKP